MSPRPALALLLALLPAAAAAAPALPPLVNVCWDYGCDRSARVVVPPRAWAGIRTLFEPPAADPAAERRRIAAAVARLERVVGARTGTDRDRHGNVVGSGRDGQMDCIDESRNTTGYLRLLANRGLLTWHEVGPRARRLRWVIDQHWTAVVVDRSDDSRWAIDSWFLDNGHRPYVQRLEDWLAKAPLPPNPDAAAGRRPAGDGLAAGDGGARRR